ncbi:MAG: GAF domain-containing protein, partial [Candidatus Omnitrophica bacterium]|nr:GAF domain-containing protein [Candidatus Omnitrophota bacterium]
MSVYSIPPLISALLFLALGIFVFLKNTKSITNCIFACSCLTTFIWQFSWTILFSIKNPTLADLLVKIGYSGIIFIPMSFYHFTMSYLREIRENKLILISYIIGIGFLISTWASEFFIRGYYIYFWGFYPKASFLHPFYLFLVFFLSIRGFRMLIIKAKQARSSPFNYNQIKYLFLAFVIYCFAISDFLVNYGFEFYPLGFIPIMASLGVITYTIVKYRLLDINIALTRAGIFVFVYALVLGIPFWIGYITKSWLTSTFVMFIFASIGLPIYNLLRRQAENRLLAEERRGRDLLAQAAEGMTRERDLKKLLSLIVHITPMMLKLTNAAIYLFDKDTKQYTLQAIRSKSKTHNTPSFLPQENLLIQWLTKNGEPLVHEEIKTQAQNTNSIKNNNLSEISAQMTALSASLIVPASMGGFLLGFLILGNKKTGRIYSQEDIKLLKTLANQAAVAIENAQFYKEDAERKALLYQSAILSDLGVMADSMGHQIKNHLQKMVADSSSQAGILEELLKQDLTLDKAKQLLMRVIEVLNKISEQGKKGANSIEAIRKFSHLSKEDFKYLSIPDALNMAKDILQFKLRFDEFDFIVDIPPDLPLIYGHPIIAEMFVNLIDNAYDANNDKEEVLDIEAKKTGNPKPYYRGKIIFQARQIDGNSIEIKIQDNGIGIKEENLK